MNNIRHINLFICVALVCSDASGQRQTDEMDLLQSSTYRLILNKEYQSELDVTSEQVREFNEMLDRIRRDSETFTEQRELIRPGGFRVLSDLDKWKKENLLLLQIDKQQQKLVSEFSRALFVSLSGEQFQRAQQIARQTSGFFEAPFPYLSSKNLLNQLGGNGVAKKEYLESVDHFISEEFSPGVDKLIRKYESRIIGNLTSDQQARTKEITGETIRYDLIPLFLREELLERELPKLFLYQDEQMLSPFDLDQHRSIMIFYSMTRIFMTKELAGELELVDSQLPKLTKLEKASAYYKHIPIPMGQLIRVSPTARRQILDAEVKRKYDQKIRDLLWEPHSKRMDTLLAHQLTRLQEVLTRCGQHHESPFHYMTTERFAKRVGLSTEESDKLKKSVEAEAKTFEKDLEKLVNSSAEKLMAQVPKKDQKLVNDMFGKPIRYFLMPQVISQSLHNATRRRKRTLDK